MSFRFLAVPMLMAMLGFGAGPSEAFPAPSSEQVSQATTGVTLAANRSSYVSGRKSYGGRSAYRKRWIRRKGHAGNWHGHHGHWNNHRKHYPRYWRARPYYYYPGYFNWGYCGWGYGALPYDCFGDDDYDVPAKRVRTSNSKHIKWCKARYKTYNVKTDTFIGKGKKKYRCNSPYDGRR
jgi:BA14K-like protein